MHTFNLAIVFGLGCDSQRLTPHLMPRLAPEPTSIGTDTDIVLPPRKCHPPEHFTENSEPVAIKKARTIMTPGRDQQQIKSCLIAPQVSVEEIPDPLLWCAHQGSGAANSSDKEGGTCTQPTCETIEIDNGSNGSNN